MSKISVIIPIFNMKKHLPRCIESVLNQTFQELEIIVVNDGSTDDSLKIVKQYATIDKRIVVLTQDNQGLGQARNTGIRAATSDFIAFVDSDDFIEPIMFEKMHQQAIDENADIVICRHQRVDENGIQTGEVSKLIDNTDKDEIFRAMISIKYLSVSWDKLYKRSLFKELDELFPALYYEDVAFIFKLFYFAKKVSFTNEIYYNWRKREGSITRTISVKHISDIFTIFDMTYEFLTKHGIYEQYKVDFLRRCVMYVTAFLNRSKQYKRKEDTEEVLLSTIVHNKTKREYFSEKNLKIVEQYFPEVYSSYMEECVDEKKWFS